MIGRLVLSGRGLYKIPKNGKMVSARKCNILSENTDDILVQTNRDFSTHDIYVLVNPITKIVEEVYGTVGNFEDDINIYHHLYTLSWVSNKKYLEMWKEYNFNQDFDIIDTLDITDSVNIFVRIEYQHQVTTIDPIGSVDLDDGYTFRFDSKYYYLDIHIADPVSYFDFSKPKMIEIFDEFINRINTCYIPNTKGSSHAIHLLPDFVVKYISLLEPTEEIKFRRAISFCFRFDRETNDVEFKLSHTKLSNIVNKTYENFDLEINQDYDLKGLLVDLSNRMIKLGGFRLDSLNLDTDISHQMIEVFMIWVNLYVGKYLKDNSSQMITRVQDSSELPENLDSIPKYCLNFINHSANYKLANLGESNLHYSLGITNYCHASSPMRRVIDMLNHLLIYKNNNLLIEKKVDLEKINSQMKIQKRISNAYDLLCYLKNSNKFSAYIMDLKVLETKTNALLVVYAEPGFKKMINVELPKNVEGLEKFKEINIELYYNSIKFKTSKYPFDIKIL